MKIQVLGSSSKGNGYILTEGNETLVIEAGVSLSEVKEVWKNVFGFESIYLISDLGRLASLKNGFHILLNTNKKGGYLSVVLKYNNKVKYTRIHRIVYESFIGKIPKGKEIHHINGNKQDNRLFNLELVDEKYHRKLTINENPNIIKSLVYHNQYIRYKKILQYDLDGNFINKYNNAKEAYRMTGVCSRNILQVANKTPYKKNKTRKQAGGYMWRFENEN